MCGIGMHGDIYGSKKRHMGQGKGGVGAARSVHSGGRAGGQKTVWYRQGQQVPVLPVLSVGVGKKIDRWGSQ